MSHAVGIIDLFFEILTWLIIVRILLSWVRHNPENPVFRILYEGTEPILAPFRRLIPKSALPLDLSPIIALLVLQIIRQVVLSLLLKI